MSSGFTGLAETGFSFFRLIDSIFWLRQALQKPQMLPIWAKQCSPCTAFSCAYVPKEKPLVDQQHSTDPWLPMALVR